MKGKAILVTGSRKWPHGRLVWQAIEEARPGYGEILVVIHGKCPTGADSHAAGYCKNNRLVASEIAMPAQWKLLGNGAGNVRNTEMVKLAKSLQACGYEVEVHAFPLADSVGTVDCMKTAEVFGLKVINHNESNRVSGVA